MQSKESVVRRRHEKMFGVPLPRRKLVLGVDSEGFPKLHEFDLVSKGLNIIGEVKSCKSCSSNFRATLNDCFFLSKVKARRKILVLTNGRFYTDFKRKTDGLISDDIEVMLVQV